MSSLMKAIYAEWGPVQNSVAWSLAFWVLIVIAKVTIQKVRSASNSSKIPFYLDGNPRIAKQRWMFDSVNLLREGYAKFGGKPFQVWTTEGSQVVLGPQYVDELKMLKDDVFTSALGDSLQIHHTIWRGMSGRPNPTVPVVHEISKHLSKILPGVRDEIESAIQIEFPRCEEWTAIQLHPQSIRVIARVSGRAFVGTALHRDEEWIQMNCDYTIALFKSAASIKTWNPMLRSVVRYFLPECRKLWASHDRAAKLLAPVIAARNKDEKSHEYERPADTVEWFRDALPASDKNDYILQAILQLGLGAAAIHTTAMAVTNSLFNLAAYPEYQDILRDEATAVLNDSGGEWNIESMAQLKKMDSFMKETQRYGGSAVATFQRKAARDITLSDGTIIPKNTDVMCASEAISHSTATYSDPDTFDGLRFYKLRLNKEYENKHQFVSTSSTEMHFGTGRHGCPGRWFASHEIKMILASLLGKYDFKLKEGEDRPKNLLFQLALSPDPRAEILCRRREV